MITALVMPVLIGSSGIAVEGGLWLYDHQSAQAAADSAALSAATAFGTNSGSNLSLPK